CAGRRSAPIKIDTASGKVWPPGLRKQQFQGKCGLAGPRKQQFPAKCGFRRSQRAIGYGNVGDSRISGDTPSRGADPPLWTLERCPLWPSLLRVRETRADVARWRSDEDPRLVGQHDELGAVAEVELLQDMRDVRLDGRVADVELLTDLRVGKPAGDEAE